MPQSLAWRWENRIPIRRRIQTTKVFVREPTASEQLFASEVEPDDADGKKAVAGPPLNHEFLRHNTEILYELFSLHGCRPKPTVGMLKTQVGFPKNKHQAQVQDVFGFCFDDLCNPTPIQELSHIYDP